MQTLRPHKQFYHLKKIDETEYSKIAYVRERKLKHYVQLINENCSQETALNVLEISRATLYRWIRRYKDEEIAGLENESTRPNKTRIPTWGQKKEGLVRKLRYKYKIWGKHKIRALLKRKFGIDLSASSVGRIIRKLVDKGTIQPVHLFACSVKQKRKRNFTGHAKRWKYGMKSKKAGELIQIDHMTVRLVNGKIVKHFNAICPFTKISFGKAFGVATSLVAGHFLTNMLVSLPFKTISIQVDGGSEFMGEFESFCKQNNIPLFVLPPRRPKYNGNVERFNATVKHEFYQFYDGSFNLKMLNNALDRYILKYNSFRPHQSLDYLTPIEYCQNTLPKGAFDAFAIC